MGYARDARSWSRRFAADGILRARLLRQGEGLALLSNDHPTN